MADSYLKHTSIDDAIEQVLSTIQSERSGEQLGLKTRFPKLNIAARKYFRFKSVNLWAGLSGHSKSYLLNQVVEDFLDYRTPGSLNHDINFIPIVLYFCFEMSSTDEILRACASDLGVNYNYLLSSHYNKDTNDYNTLTDEELIKVRKFLEFYKKKNILFFETSGNIRMIYNTVKAYHAGLEASRIKKGIKKPYKYIINVDHTLLIDQLGEKDILELMRNVGKYGGIIRKEFGAMVNLIGQLNNKIEDIQRILKPSLHYPVKSDIYAQAQLYNACDAVFTIHQPGMLKIDKYGKKQIPTPGLIHLQALKNRHGNIGNIWLFNNLANGSIISYPSSDGQAENDENINSIE